MSNPTQAVETILARVNAPAEVHAGLERLRQELTEAAGENLAGLILYGGLARGRFRPGKSDVNVVVLLHESSAAALTAIAPALRAAWRSIRVEPFILRPAELARAADVFPTKLLDIQAHHLVLHGADPFTDFKVEREHVRLRVEQELRNLTLRLRRRYLAIFDDPAALAQALTNIVVPLRIELLTLLQLVGKPEPAEAISAAVFTAATAAFPLDGEALARIAALRQASPETSLPDDLAELYSRVLATIALAAEIADRLEKEL